MTDDLDILPNNRYLLFINVAKKILIDFDKLDNQLILEE